MGLFDRPNPAVLDFRRWSEMISPCGTKSCATIWKCCCSDTFAQNVLWKQEQDEVRRRKTAANKLGRGTCQEMKSQKQDPTFCEVEHATSERLDKLSKHTCVSMKLSNF